MEPHHEQSIRRRFVLLALLLFLVVGSGFPRPVAAASEGFQRWFRCGLRYWTACQRRPQAPPLPAGRNQPTDTQKAGEPALSAEELAMWGTPVVGPSGNVSYQLPPKPLLDLFRQPSDETAKAYLQLWKDKAGRREEAFAAMRRIATELGFESSPGARDNPTSNFAPVLGMTSPEVTSLSATGLFPPLPAETTSSVRHEQTPVAATATGSKPSAKPVTEMGTGVSPASWSVLPTATVTREIPGQQTRIFYFFSPRCPYCAQQTPLLNSLAQARRDVVGIAMDTDREELLAHVRQMRISFPVTLDQGESHRFGVTAYPALIVSDTAGNATRLQGLLTRGELERVFGGAK
jgi:thiol-disulfide isomerase/thioredoxin